MTSAKPSEFRFQSAAIVGGDYLVIASSLDQLNENFISNLKNLGLFTAGADALAIFFSIYFLRRHNRGLDAQALQRMQRFLGDASHELRTPLTIISGEVEIAIRNENISEKQQKALAKIKDEADRLENILTSLLGLRQI